MAQQFISSVKEGAWIAPLGVGGATTCLVACGSEGVFVLSGSVHGEVGSSESSRRLWRLRNGMVMVVARRTWVAAAVYICESKSDVWNLFYDVDVFFALRVCLCPSACVYLLVFVNSVM